MKITKEFLESEIVEIKYTRLSGTLTHCAITVQNGYVFTGESACAYGANFNEEMGKVIAYENAFKQMWQPYIFWAKQVNYQQKTKACNSPRTPEEIDKIMPGSEYKIYQIRRKTPHFRAEI